LSGGRDWRKEVEIERERLSEPKKVFRSGKRRIV
jgi:hypothetical protein